MNRNTDIGALPVSQCERIRELGHGGSSVVYLVRHKESGEQFAMKVQRAGERREEELLSEAAALKSLGGACPGIPAFICGLTGEDGAFAGFLMEYVEGESLQKILQEGRVFSVRESAEMGLHLCRILEYMHGKEPPLIYRDLKPANILIRPDKEPVIIDYGAVRKYRAGADRDTHPLGTEGYAAPEQYGGWEQSDARTDIYGIGAVLHHMLTGLSPLETGLAPLEEFVRSGRIGNSAAHGKIPRSYREMDKILRRACSAAGAMRFSSCAEMGKALRSVIRLCEREETASVRLQMSSDKKWKVFVRLRAAAVALLVCSGLWWAAADSAEAAQYRIYLDEAQRAKEPAEKAGAYRRAIGMRPSDRQAYLAFLGDLSEDALITNKEREAFEDASYIALEEIRETKPSTYAQLQMQIGKAYFAFYEGGPEAARQAFRNVSDNAGFLYEGRKTAEAMCVVLGDSALKERGEAWLFLERESVRGAESGADGAFAAAVCRAAAGDIAFKADLYRSAGTDEEVIREIADLAAELLRGTCDGRIRVPGGLRRDLRTAVESAERRLGDRN